MIRLRSIEEVPESELKNKRVLVRTGYDVPIENGRVVDEFRILESLPTIEYLLSKGARVILISHIGRDVDETLKPVSVALREHIDVRWAGDETEEGIRAAINVLEPGEVLLLENLRKNPGEVGNDEIFGQELAELGELYVNDAFSVLHRRHASIVQIPKHIPAFAGFSLLREVEQLSKAFTPKSPALFILGGAKFDTKVPLIEKFLELYDTVFVGGALAHDIWRARGIGIGQSVVSGAVNDTLAKNEKILLPVDVLLRKQDGTTRTAKIGDVAEDEAIIDCGPETVAALSTLLKKSKTVLWNGTLGLYEDGGKEGTLALAKAIAESECYSIIGGGDTVAAIEELNIKNKFGFVSTGGGAMLEFLERGTLPGLAALEL